MRKICDSSRYFTSVRLTSSALGRSWPIGFSTTTRVKFGASGLSISPAFDQPLDRIADRFGRNRQVVNAIGRDAARFFDSFKFSFKFCETVGMVEPGRGSRGCRRTSPNTPRPLSGARIWSSSRAHFCGNRRATFRAARIPAPRSSPASCPRRMRPDCTATESACAWRDRPTRRRSRPCMAARAALVV